MVSFNHYTNNRSQKRKSRSKSRKSLHLTRDRSKSFYASVSPIHSEQGYEGSCAAHTMSHLIVKNIFGTLYPLKMSKRDEEKYNQYSCNDFLKTHKLLDVGEVQNCSVIGYYKILLFLYVYFTLYDNFILKEDTKFYSRMISFVLHLDYMPKIFHQTFHYPILLHLLTTMKQKIKDLNITFNTVEIDNYGDELIIRKLVDSGFYVAMDLIENNREKKIKDLSGHAATIVGSTPSHFVIKNSWFEVVDHFSYKNILSVNKFKNSNMKWVIQRFFTVLPIFGNMELYDGERSNFVTDFEIYKKEIPFYKKWLYDYIAKFKSKI
jgi:hypothetical protein